MIWSELDSNFTLEDLKEKQQYYTLIVEDEYSRIGHAYYDKELDKWLLETFGECNTKIEFGQIIKYIFI